MRASGRHVAFLYFMCLSISGDRGDVSLEVAEIDNDTADRIFDESIGQRCGSDLTRGPDHYRLDGRTWRFVGR